MTRLRWSNAGHPPPMVITPDGQVRVLADRRPELLLGVDLSTSRSESVVTLARGSVIVFYTDGLVERRTSDLDEGQNRLQRALTDLADRDLDALCDELLRRMLPASPDDDVALIAVRLHPQDRPRPPEAGPHRVPPNVPPG